MISFETVLQDLRYGVSSHLLPGAYPHNQFSALCRSIAIEVSSAHSSAVSCAYGRPNVGKPPSIGSSKTASAAAFSAAIRMTSTRVNPSEVERAVHSLGADAFYIDLIR
jgi:hypothetical protein